MKYVQLGIDADTSSEFIHASITSCECPTNEAMCGAEMTTSYVDGEHPEGWRVDCPEYLRIIGCLVKVASRSYTSP